MNNKEFISALSERTGFTLDATQRIVNTAVEQMSDHFQGGDSMMIPNFGLFEVKKKLERIMVNPSTGQRMLVPPKLVLGFKPNNNWKTRIKTGGTE